MTIRIEKLATLRKTAGHTTIRLDAIEVFGDRSRVARATTEADWLAIDVANCKAIAARDWASWVERIHVNVPHSRGAVLDDRLAAALLRVRVSHPHIRLVIEAHESTDEDTFEALQLLAGAVGATLALDDLVSRSADPRQPIDGDAALIAKLDGELFRHSCTAEHRWRRFVRRALRPAIATYPLAIVEWVEQVVQLMRLGTELDEGDRLGVQGHAIDRMYGAVSDAP